MTAFAAGASVGIGEDVGMDGEVTGAALVVVRVGDGADGVAIGTGEFGLGVQLDHLRVGIEDIGVRGVVVTSRAAGGVVGLRGLVEVAGATVARGVVVGEVMARGARQLGFGMDLEQFDVFKIVGADVALVMAGLAGVRPTALAEGGGARGPFAGLAPGGGGIARDASPRMGR